MIDTHCHLADTKFKADLSHVIQRAKEAGVTRMITIADSFAEGEECLKIASKNEGVYCTVGVHPHESKSWARGDDDVLRKQAKSSIVKAIGEIGLDYHYDFSPRDAQKLAFETQLRVAAELGLPAVIHNREAMTDLHTIVEKVRPQKFVLHCCTETFADAVWVLEMGGMLSFTGIATYSTAEDIRETIRQCPLERLMIETDAPYLAPVPYRGKRNEPAYVVEVAKLIAKLKGVSVTEIERATTENAVAFFGLTR